ncbi:6-phosphogluconolactonase [sulfur-oxidizing endosymbiont of Gigantopelta aegis]|uniref:6-phosphogluconolactonase n=1 Tax=sulfur-oxidizing endosymbiont of Gigantopelta aegis TaxID=2794934 RepID=UPI0018DB13A5|nr:6-phosphogluconolactonase [sulfur-oxidizing endosymbiont of Gigantopelta aegis]
MTHKTHWQVFDNHETVAQTATDKIIHSAQKAIAQRDVFKLVLAGGTSPKQVYQLLAEHDLDWSKWQLFIGDERCLPDNDPERNSLMIEQNWLENTPDFPRENYHPIKAELGAKDGASDYAETIKDFLPFDMVLLGMGEDGHTASLFPGHQHDKNALTHAVYNSPKPPSERVSLSLKTIALSEQVLILVTGSGKKEAVRQWLEIERLEKEGLENNETSLPIAQILAKQSLEVLVSQDAMPE